MPVRGERRGTLRHLNAGQLNGRFLLSGLVAKPSMDRVLFDELRFKLRDLVCARTQLAPTGRGLFLSLFDEFRRLEVSVPPGRVGDVKAAVRSILARLWSLPAFVSAFPP